MYILTF